MRAVKRRSRLRAIRGALREAERHLIEDETVCVAVYQKLGSVSVFRQEGRSRRVIAKYSWNTNVEGG